MKFRAVGTVAACALVLLAYAPFAGADSIKLDRIAKVGSSATGIPDRDSWDGTRSTGLFNAVVVSGQLSGSWDLGKVDPFRRDTGREGDVRTGFQEIALAEVQAFLSSPQAANHAATLEFETEENGKHDGDHMDDFHLAVTSAAFTQGKGKAKGKPVSAAQPLPTPEPASLVLLGSGVAGLAAYRVRRRKRAQA
jgi:hypothetical protein